MRRLAIVLCVTLLPVAAAGAGQPGQALPDGPGADVYRARCLGCHGSDLVADQRLTRAAWDREVAKMERWSQQVSAPDRERLLDYLARWSDVRSSPPLDPVVARAGQAVYTRACLSCHDGTLIEQQRLSESAWRRSVAKMVQWGARVEASDLTSLAAYLASRWGPP